MNAGEFFTENGKCYISTQGVTREATTYNQEAIKAFLRRNNIVFSLDNGNLVVDAANRATLLTGDGAKEVEKPLGLTQRELSAPVATVIKEGRNVVAVEW